MKTVFIILVFAMYVCVCLAVTDREVQAAIENGATTRESVTRACRAGGDCGACHGMIATMIEDHLEESGPVRSPNLVPEAALVRTRAA
jgi:bacterioferritin-associated ferredoxin